MWWATCGTGASPRGRGGAVRPVPAVSPRWDDDRGAGVRRSGRLGAHGQERDLRPSTPRQPINGLVTLPELLRGSVSPQRFTLLLLGGFAALALVLAAVGVYGVIAYAVGQRTREIGIRMALGAAGREIRRTVIAPAVGLAAIGVALGSVAAWLLGGVLAPELLRGESARSAHVRGASPASSSPPPGRPAPIPGAPGRPRSTRWSP